METELPKLVEKLAAELVLSLCRCVELGTKNAYGDCAEHALESCLFSCGCVLVSDFSARKGNKCTDKQADFIVHGTNPGKLIVVVVIIVILLAFVWHQSIHVIIAVWSLNCRQQSHQCEKKSRCQVECCPPLFFPEFGANNVLESNETAVYVLWFQIKCK